MCFIRFLKRLLSFGNTPKADEPKVRLWMRMGVTFEVSAEQAQKILVGNSEVLDAMLHNKESWYFDGDSYIPSNIAHELCQKLGLDYEDYKGDIEYDVWRGDNHGA